MLCKKDLGDPSRIRTSFHGSMVRRSQSRRSCLQYTMMSGQVIWLHRIQRQEPRALSRFNRRDLRFECLFFDQKAGNHVMGSSRLWSTLKVAIVRSSTWNGNSVSNKQLLDNRFVETQHPQKRRSSASLLYPINSARCST